MDGGSGLFLRWTTSERQKPSATGEYSMRIRHALAGFAFAACLVSPTTLVASPKLDATMSPRPKFDIAPPPPSSALRQLSTQSGVRILFPYDEYASNRRPRAPGWVPTEGALNPLRPEK